MRQKGWLSQLWNLFGPLFLEAAVSIGVSMAANTVLLIKNMDAYMAALHRGSQEALMSFMNSQMNELLSFSGEITIATAICTIPIMVFLGWRDDKKRRQKGIECYNRDIPWGKFFLITPFAGAVGLGLNNLMILSNLTAVGESYTHVSEVQYSMPVGLQLVGLGVITPICEELIFRKLIYRRLRDEKMSFLRAMILSSLIFGIYHGNLVQFIYAFLLGMMLAYLYEVYHSMVAPVIAHVLVNIIAIVLTGIDVFTWMFSKPIRMGIVTVICAAVGSALFVLISRLHPDIQLFESQRSDDERK